MMKRLPSLLGLLLGTGLALPVAAQVDTLATSYRPDITLRGELGFNSFGPLAYGNKNLFLPITFEAVKRFTLDNGRQPTSGLRFRGVVDPTIHRMDEAAYATYTLLQTGRFAGDLTVFIESSPVKNFSLNARAGAELRFYPLFEEQGDWKFYETFDQLLLHVGGGFAYRMPKTDTKYGLLEGSLDYRKHQQNFSTRSEQYYRQYIESGIRFSSLQAQLRYTRYYCPGVGWVFTGNWYGRSSGNPQTKFFDLRLGVVFNLNSKHKDKKGEQEQK